MSFLLFALVWAWRFSSIILLTSWSAFSLSVTEKKNWELNCALAATCKFELKPKADDSSGDILEVKDGKICSIKLCGFKWLVGGVIITFYKINDF